ncbi:MAG: glycosyltransferase family 4 protein [Bacteroides sp.]|nr:glycosyltransferase family 4 protein [Bacteroides sp.]
MKPILLINNGYPSRKYPNYCSYIESIEACIKQSTKIPVQRNCIYYEKRKYKKVWNYIKWYLSFSFLRYPNYSFLYINHPTFALPLILPAIFFKVKMIFHWHGDELASQKIVPKYLRMLLQFITKKHLGILNIVPSYYFLNLLNNSLKIDKKQIMVSPSGGIDTSLYYPKSVNPNKEVCIIGFSAAIVKEKGIEDFYNVITKYQYLEETLKRRVYFKFINYGKSSSEFIERLSKYKDHIIISNRMSNNEMPSFYNSIDLLFMPSKRKGESLGLVSLEAMSCGVPVLAYNVNAYPEFIVPGISGELLTSDVELDVILDTIVYIIKRKEFYNPRSIVMKSYSKQYVINQYKEIFDR